ncbi:MAG: SusC/RagA family TonB-linked outer membrane protein, partial [Chryseobacterium sp.]
MMLNKSGNDIEGTVVDTNNTPIPNATVKIKGTGVTAVSNEVGKFKISSLNNSGILVVSSLGFIETEGPFSPTNRNLKLVLKAMENKLEDVQVVSTGYQNLPKERATGSFVRIDSNLLNRRTGAFILDRLDGVASGLLFNANKQNPNGSNLTVRGVSTIFANDEPLIVLDNFPYPGDIRNINPNDIENITVLKDAAAASIWGVKAGNGVIVITTKKGGIEKPLLINVNANIGITNRSNLYYLPQLTASEYIGVETDLFSKGYNFNIANGYSAISPVIELLQDRKTNKISAEELAQKINDLSGIDIRKDQNRYLYRPSTNQQYQLNLSGGGKVNQFYVSSGYDRNLQQLISDKYSRVTLNANNTYSMLKNSIQLSTGISIVESGTFQNTGVFNPSRPYEQLASSSGMPLAVVRDLRKSYIDTAGSGRLLDWRYFPLAENHPNQYSKLNDYRLNANLTINITKGLKLSGLYLYQRGSTNLTQTYLADSYFTRNLI